MIERGGPITAWIVDDTGFPKEARDLGFVAEVVPHDMVLDRAREIAQDLAAKNTQMLRFMRVALTQHIKRRMLDDLGYGLMLEGMGIMSMLGK